MKYLKKINEHFGGELMPTYNNKKTEPDLTDPDGYCRANNITRLNGFFDALGIELTPSIVEEPNVSMRVWPTSVLYSFKIKEDFEKVKKYLSERDWYKYDERHSEGARYPFQIII